MTHALVLPVGEDRYAVPIDQVREVVAAPKVTALPTAPAVVLGLFNLRGQIVPLLDTAVLTGVGTIERPEFSVVADSAHGFVALAATGCPQRAVLDTAIGPSDLPGTSGLFRLDDGVATLLDPQTLLTRDRVGGSGARIEPGNMGGP